MQTLDELYRTYGQQMIQQEILNGQINQTKQAIAAALNASIPSFATNQLPDQDNHASPVNS